MEGTTFTGCEKSVSKVWQAVHGVIVGPPGNPTVDGVFRATPLRGGCSVATDCAGATVAVIARNVMITDAMASNAGTSLWDGAAGVITASLYRQVGRPDLSTNSDPWELAPHATPIFRTVATEKAREALFSGLMRGVPRHGRLVWGLR